jgi:riboflavin kinase / FMN adenylyltransferase
MALATLHAPEEWAGRFGASGRRTAITIGNFDGVHLGHQKILRTVLDRANEKALLAAALTFDPHPVCILRPAEAPSPLTTMGQKLVLLDETGLDAVLVMRFDANLARVSPEDFVRRYLVETIRAEAVLVGENFRFGHKHAGDTQLLEVLGKQQGFVVEVVPPVAVEGVVVSSTLIRQMVREGRVEDARKMLGRPFALAGEIAQGAGQGRKLVVPTLNLRTTQESMLKTGVYVTETMVEGRSYKSATNIGLRPTFDGSHRTIESHLFDFSQIMTSGPMEIRFWARLRDEMKFTAPEALREQVMKDLEQARRFFSEKR